MVLVFEQLIDRPKAEQWVDRVVSMASKSFQEHSKSASKAMSSAYSRSVTRVSSCSFLYTVPHKFGIVKIGNSNTFVLHLVTVQRHMNDSIKIQIKKCRCQNTPLAHSTGHIKALRYPPIRSHSSSRSIVHSPDDRD